MLAVIKTGGKQYLVKKGDKIKVEKLEGKQGSEINFTDVLLLQKDKEIEIGKPIIKDAKVIAKILEQGRGDKVIIFKYKAKKRYKKKAGHRQPYTEIEIKEILFSTKKSVS
jgi:large subunit ribosomal protein L21